MNDGGLKACVKRGAAYAVLMEGLYPDIRQVYFDPADLDDVVKKLRKGDCHAYVDVRASLEIVAGLSRFCEHGLAMPGEPIASGPQDMAVGVREDLVDVRDALSFWVNVVRTCSPVMPDPACYGQWNVEDMWRHWARDSCDAAVTGEERKTQLGVDAFALPLAAILLTSLAVVVLELSTDRARHRAATLLRRTDGLLNALRSRRRWWHERDASKFLLSAFVEDVRRGAAGVHEELRRPLLDYYLTTDMVAWKALKKALTTLTDLLAKLEGADGERPAENFDRLHKDAVDAVAELARRAAHETLVAHKLGVARRAVRESVRKASDRGRSPGSLRRQFSDTLLRRPSKSRVEPATGEEPAAPLVVAPANLDGGPPRLGECADSMRLSAHGFDLAPVQTQRRPRVDSDSD